MSSLKDEIAAAAGGAKHDQLTSIPDRPRLMQLDLDDIYPDPNQPRTELGDLEEMAASIREHGILQPIVVSPLKDQGYSLIMGERRLSAAKLAGLKTISCIVRTLEEHKRLEVQVVENIHRKAFTAVEEAKAYQRLIDEYNYRHEDLAAVLGKSRTSVTQTLSVLKLPPDMLARAQKDPNVTTSLLLEVSKEQGEIQEKMFEAVMAGQATVRSLRAVKAAAMRSEPTTSTVVITHRSGKVHVKMDVSDPGWAEVVESLRSALRTAEMEFTHAKEEGHWNEKPSGEVHVPVGIEFLRRP